MTRLTLFNVTSSTVLLASAAVVLGAPGGHEGAGTHEVVGAMPTWQQGVVTGVVSIVVFLLVLAVLGTKVWPVITSALDERAQKIRSEIEAAERARVEAKAAQEQFERSLAEARAEAQKELEKAKAGAVALAAELKAQADADMATMKDRAMREIDSAKRQALTEIYTQTAGLATAVAAKILSREVNRNDQQRLVDDCLKELKSPAHA